MELFRAHHQWASRPSDERFKTLPELYAATKGYAEQAAESHDVPFSTLSVCAEANDDNMYLTGSEGRKALISHHAFGQLAARAGAPAAYLRGLPSTLAVQNINHGLKERTADGEKHNANLLFHKNGGLVLRAATTEVYERLWNWEVAERLMELAERFNLTPAVPTFTWGDGELKGQDNPALYASDHDMFVFLMDRNRNVGGSAEGLFRGIIVQNGEVGGVSLSMMKFLFRDLCQNHIIWDASDVSEIRMRHVGNLRGKWNEFHGSVRTYLDSSDNDEDNMIFVTKKFKLGGTKEEVLDKLFGKRSFQFSRKMLNAAYEANVPEEDGDPNTAWGFVQGLTRHSQTVPFADERTKLDRAGRKILQLAF